MCKKKIQLLAGAGLLLVIAPFVNIQFLGSSLTFMMVSSTALIQPQHTLCARNGTMHAICKSQTLTDIA